MRIAFISGDSYRHKYYCNSVLDDDNYEFPLLIKVKRFLNIVDETPVEYLTKEDKELLDAHTEMRIIKEREYFLPKGGSFNEKNVKKVIEVDQRDVNSSKVIKAFKEAKPDVVIVFGVSLLKKELLCVMPKYVINLSGLSPYYKGAATLFWPFYFMEPQYAGHTFHIIDDKIDHGGILHQGRPEIYENDTLPDIGARDVIKAAEELPKLLKKLEFGDIKIYPQKNIGKLFYKKDFKPHHLRVIKKLIEEGFLKEYIKNRHLFPDPKIITQV